MSRRFNENQPSRKLLARETRPLTAESELDRLPHQSIDAAFVCLNDDANAASVRLSLQSGLSEATPITVRVPEESGFALLLAGHSDSKEPIEGVSVIHLMDIACTLELFK